MIKESAHVVIVGSGMGGGTLAWGLAQRGIDTLVLERGEVLPREPQNWSPEAVFLERRYKPDETWLDDDGNEFHPGVHYVVGGNTKVYGASLPRLRERDFAETVLPLGGLARLALLLRRPRAVLRAGRVAVPRARDDGRGPVRALAEQPVPLPAAAP